MQQADRFSRGIAKEKIFRKEFPVFFESKRREMKKKKRSPNSRLCAEIVAFSTIFR